MLKKILLFLLLMNLFASCSLWHGTRAKRLPASNDETCRTNLFKVLKSSYPDNFDNELKAYIEKSTGKYWKWHGRITWWRWAAQSIKPLRVSLIRRFRNLNANQIPILYIEDKDESLITISKFKEIFKQNLKEADFEESHKLAWANVNKWIKSFEAYPEKLDLLLREYTSLSFAMNYIKKQKESIKKYPHRLETHQFVEVKDSKGKVLRKEFQIVVKEFNNSEDVDFYLAELKRRKNAITKRGFGRIGELRETEIEQAMHMRRLQFIHTRINDEYLSFKRNGGEINKELEVILSKIKDLVTAPGDLKPSPNIVVRLEFSELVAEARDLFKTVSDSAAGKFVGKLYGTLTENEKEMLQLDDKGRAGRFFTMIKENKWYIAGVSVASGGASFWTYFEDIKNAFRSDADRRYDCVKLLDDEEFYECVQKYLSDKFILNNPFQFVANGYEGLLRALANDEEKAAEFVALVNLIQDERVAKIYKDKREAAFEKAFLEGIKEIIEEGDDPTKKGGFTVPEETDQEN